MKDDSIIAITYADSEFKRAGRALGVRVLTKGIDKFILFRRDDLCPEFRQRNSRTLKYKKGAGYWVWKPQIIKQTLDFVRQGALVLYLDAGILLKEHSSELINLVNDDKIHVWAHGYESVGEWTDPGVLSSMNFPQILKSFPLIMGGAIVGRNSNNFRDFVFEWGELCSNPQFLHPDSSPSYTAPDDIVWHRYDQSLLSAFVAMNPHRFVIHHEGIDQFDMHKMFDVHRNLKIKTIGIVIKFPELRRIRTEIMKVLPKEIVSRLKAMEYERKRKPISNIEAQRVKNYIKQRTWQKK